MPVRLTARLLRGALAVVVVSAVTAGVVAPLAAADSLTDQRDRVKRQIAATKQVLNESTHQLNAAVAAVETATSKLAVARAEFARTQRDLAAAKKRDVAMAAQLRQTRADLAEAKAKVVQGQRELDAEQAMVGNMVRDQYQQQTNLLPIALLTSSTSMGDFQTRIQWATTMFDTTQATIVRLQELQTQLVAEKARQTTLEQQVATQRQAAAENLATTRTLEAQAKSQAASVATLLGRARSARASAASDVASDQKQYAALQSERGTVERRIAMRIAAQKATAARAAARARAAEQAAVAARTKVAAVRKGRSSRSSSRPSTSSPARSSGSISASAGSASHGFIYPVNAPITSPYGMRLHPVLHYWKLHDGTDFGAGCGTPIHAAYSGTVVEKYFNAGYGNRLMIDHGNVDGSYVTTGYNHAIRYTVGVGQHVSTGQLIGYVGTTGYSTGCHLHLMVWRNGSMINPMTWY
ncbi:MAG: peptidoglycan DD-metalloendopeptidase family protein [Propionibacteriaceae bacterium]